MRALLWKDYYTLSKQLNFYLVFIILLAVIPQFHMISIGTVYAAMLPITAMAYDERSKWDQLAVMMPYQSRNIVLSKFVIGYIGIAITSVFAIVLQIVINLITQTAVTTQQILAILVTSCAALTLLALNLPFMFWLGVERGRIAFLVIVGLTVFAGMMGAQQSEKLLDLPDVNAAVILACSAGAALLMNLLSITISHSIYIKKKQ